MDQSSPVSKMDAEMTGVRCSLMDLILISCQVFRTLILSYDFINAFLTLLRKIPRYFKHHFIRCFFILWCESGALGLWVFFDSGLESGCVVMSPVWFLYRGAEDYFDFLDSFIILTLSPYHLSSIPVYPSISICTSLSSRSTLFALHLALFVASPPSPSLSALSALPSTVPPPPLFPFLHSRHSELFSMSSFIAGARSQLQLITEHRAGGTRSAFRSALSLHFAINPFHTKPHHTTSSAPHLPLFLHLSSLYFSTRVYALTFLPPSFNWFFFWLAIFSKVFLATVSLVQLLNTLMSLILRLH